MDLKERHFSIDAGKGEKMNGCPYSLFEDGHDVQDYIIPPKGYYFVGFQFVPMQDNAIYDGKLVAKYRRKPLKNRIEEALSSLVWVFIVIAVIGIIVLLAVSVFKPKKTPNRSPIEQETEIQALPMDSIVESDSIFEETQDTALFVQQNVENQPNNTVETTSEQEVTDNQPTFNQAFWTLIHQREGMMDTYMDLYTANKGIVSGQEFDYLRFTILKDYPTFKEWHSKLRKIPKDELETIESINALKDRLKTID